jgi:hypothetical protein
MGEEEMERRFGERVKERGKDTDREINRQT